jgi:branched-chain amino acid transport system ATP-binding protein
MSSETRPALRAEDVTAGYGGLPIVRGVSLDARAGAITLVIGPNGSGKSTFLRAVSGTLRERGGRVTLDREGEAVEIHELAPHQRLALGLTYVPQERTGFVGMTVEENILLGGWLWRRKRDELEKRVADVYEVIPLLRDLKSRRLGDLSGGQQKLTEVGRALVSRPAVLVLDEPTAGLAPSVAGQLLELFRKIADERSVAVLLVEQNIEIALEMADHAYCLVAGLTSLDAPAADVRARLPEIVESWLWSREKDPPEVTT